MAGKGYMTSSCLEAAQYGSALEEMAPASPMLLAIHHNILPEIQRAAIWALLGQGKFLKHFVSGI